MDLNLSAAVCKKLVFLQTVGSTNDFLAAEANADFQSWPDFSVVCANEQTTGKGRNQRAWLSPAGASLSVSILIRNPSHAAHWYGMLLAVALTESLISQGTRAGLKWPNDVLVGERKIAGVLGSAHKDLVVVGIGVNLLQIDLEQTESIENLGLNTDYDFQLSELLKNFAIIRSNFESAGKHQLLAKLRDVSHTLGKKIRVQTDAGEIVGVATEIDSSGMLVLNHGEHRISAGDILHLRGETT